VTDVVLSWIGEKWVDLLSVFGGLLYVCILHQQKKISHNVISRTTGLLFLEGLAIPPLVLLIPAAFDTKVLQAIMSSSRVTLVGASVIAIMALLESRWHPDTSTQS
jgi:hypothetical protein